MELGNFSIGDTKSRQNFFVFDRIALRKIDSFDLCLR